MKSLAYTYKGKGGNFYMEYAKDEIFQIQYDTKLNRLQIKKKRWTSRLYQKIKRHKLITTTIITFFLLATINVVMIYNFMQILMKIEL